jgi:hypothetical protein
MIDGKGAVAIATEYLKSKGIDVEGFAEARFLPDEKMWTCCFSNKIPTDGVDCPGMTIVNVKIFTGEACIFETM